MALNFSSPFKDQLISLVEAHYSSTLGISESLDGPYLTIMMSLDLGGSMPEWKHILHNRTSQDAVDLAYGYFFRTMKARLSAGKDPFRIKVQDQQVT